MSDKPLPWWQFKQTLPKGWLACAARSTDWFLRAQTYRIERTGLMRALRALEVIAILVAIAAFVVECSNREEERTVRAWQLVTTKATGNSGKREALEYLNRQGTILGWPAKDDHWAYDWLPLKKRTELVGINLGVEKTGDPGTFLNKADLPGAALSNANLVEALANSANLQGADLQNATLNRAELRRADLARADLAEADLVGTLLYGANLREANLSGGNLSDAGLRGADLTNANLRYSTLVHAKLQKAVLVGADLSFASLAGALLAGADLTDAKLDDVNLSGANFVFGPFVNPAKGLKQSQVASAWACEAYPPELPEGLAVPLWPCDAQRCRIGRVRPQHCWPDRKN